MNLRKETTQNAAPRAVMITLLLCFCTILFSCSKSDSSSPGGSKFNPADFKISNIVTTVNSSDVQVNYDETNSTSMNYTYDNDGSFRIKWTVKTTDGTQYQEDRLLATELDAGAAAALSCVIDFTPGKTVDVSTLKYEVYFNH